MECGVCLILVPLYFTNWDSKELTHGNWEHLVAQKRSQVCKLKTKSARIHKELNQLRKVHKSASADRQALYNERHVLLMALSTLLGLNVPAAEIAANSEQAFQKVDHHLSSLCKRLADRSSGHKEDRLIRQLRLSFSPKRNRAPNS